MAEYTTSTSYTLLTYILNFQWILKTHASLPPRLIMASTVTSITQILHRLYSLALLSLSLTLERLRSYRTLAIALGLKSTNHSLRSPGIHVTFSQTLNYSQTLSLISLYHLLLSSSQTLKQTPLKSSLKGLSVTIPVPLRHHVISGSRFKQLSYSVYYMPRLKRPQTLRTTRSSILRITTLHRKKGLVSLITSYSILQKRRSLRYSFLLLLLTSIQLTTRYLVISHNFTLRRRPSVQLSKILVTTGESHERRVTQMTLKLFKRGQTQQSKGARGHGQIYKGSALQTKYRPSAEHILRPILLAYKIAVTAYSRSTYDTSTLSSLRGYFGAISQKVRKALLSSKRGNGD